MQSFYRMKNPIQDYDWGDPRHIPEFLGLDWPVGRPAAEVWMGAHPSSPSMIDIQGEWVAMDSWLHYSREAALGGAIVRDYGRLPFLFKLLAAGQSLSIQAHPSKIEAESGFAHENAEGLPSNSPNRNYKDDNHKPEIIMALTPFTAMIGFQEPGEIAANFRLLIENARHNLMEKLAIPLMEGDGAKGLRGFFENLLTLQATDRNYLISAAAVQSQYGENSLRHKWITRLTGQFPGDIGVLAPLFLHVIELQPGQALYLPPKTLHAYLEGFGVELMANSDNVLRGGLTPKNVDIPELLHILDFQSMQPNILRPPGTTSANTLFFFPAPAREFALGIGILEEASPDGLSLPSSEGPLIILSLEGRVHISDGSQTLNLAVGESAFIPHCAPQLKIKGQGRMAVAKTGH